jgi:hypothetical protein
MTTLKTVLLTLAAAAAVCFLAGFMPGRETAPESASFYHGAPLYCEALPARCARPIFWRPGQYFQAPGFGYFRSQGFRGYFRGPAVFRRWNGRR